MRTIKKTLGQYKVLEGSLLTWTRGDAGRGHDSVLVEPDGRQQTFVWRAPEDPTAGDQICLAMPGEGPTVKPDRPFLILNQTSGESFQEPNAPDPVGSRAIMTKLILWVMIAFLVAMALMLKAEGLMRSVIILISASLIVWRLAIATSDIRFDERLVQRRREEQEIVGEILAGKWKQQGARLPRVNAAGLNALGAIAAPELTANEGEPGPDETA